MLTYSFSNIGSDSLYGYLYKSMKRDILDGTLPPNSKLPSKRNFAKNLNVSTITIENAYAQLMAEGYIYSIPKRGYYVSEISLGESALFFTESADNHTGSMPVMDSHDNKDANISVEVASASKNPHNSSINLQKKNEYFADFISNNIYPENFPFSTWAKLMRETITEKKELLMTPLPSAGAYELRSAISDHLRQFRGMNVSPEQIIIGAGTEYLYNLIIQLLGHNLTYAVEDPGYRKIGRIYESNQVSCKYIPLDSSGIDVNKLEESGADVIHLSPSHHFPTGIVTSISKRYELLGWAVKTSNKAKYIIEDDYDSEFRLLGKPIPSLESIDVMERVIYMNSFSKSLTSTIRISYMVLPKHLVERYNQKLSFYSCTVSSFEQYTLAKFINEGYFEKHINRMRNYYRKLRDVLLAEIKASALSKRCKILEADSGLHFLLCINSSFSDMEIRENAKKNGINVSFLSDYYHKPTNGHEHILIINYSGIPEEKIPEAVRRLETCF